MGKSLIHHIWDVVQIHKTGRRNQPLFLTISLFMMLLLFPFLQGKFGNEEGYWANLALCVFFSSIMISSIMVVWKNTVLWMLIFFIGLPWIIIHWLDFFDTGEFPAMLHFEAGLMTFFCIIMFIMLMQRIVSSPIVTSHTILNAISAYLFIGLCWASMYALILLHNIDALKTSMDVDLMNFSGLWDCCVYYSFTTMTTVGYGDITPVTPMARSLALIQAIVGPLYLTILIARLVGMYKRTSYLEKDKAADI